MDNYVEKFNFFFSSQAEYFAAVLDGRVMLPSRKEMMENSKLPENVPPSKAHYMLPNQTLPYYDDLALAAGSDPIPNFIKKAFFVYYEDVMNNPLYYRERDLYIFNNNSTFEYVNRHETSCK